jgi:hypothetical protein
MKSPAYLKDVSVLVGLGIPLKAGQQGFYRLEDPA